MYVCISTYTNTPTDIIETQNPDAFLQYQHTHKQTHKRKDVHMYAYIHTHTHQQTS